MIKCPPRTFQGAFNHVWDFLNKQGKPSIRASKWAASVVNTLPECIYLSPDGCRCAAGALLPEKLTPEEVTNIDVFNGTACDTTAVLDNVDWGVDLDFLTELQNAHDSPAIISVRLIEGEMDTLGTNIEAARKTPNEVWLDMWRTSMKKLARKYNLKVPESE